MMINDSQPGHGKRTAVLDTVPPQSPSNLQRIPHVPATNALGAAHTAPPTAPAPTVAAAGNATRRSTAPIRRRPSSTAAKEAEEVRLAHRDHYGSGCAQHHRHYS